MKVIALAILLAGVVLSAGCHMGKWEHGASWEARTSEAPRESPYMPTIHDEERLRKAQHHSWVEVHVPKTGLVGYMGTEVEGMHEVGGPKKLHYVFDVEMNRIGFYTQLGATYRYVFDDYVQTKEFIGHYEAEEAIAHLLRVPVPIQFKPLTAKPPKY